MPAGGGSDLRDRGSPDESASLLAFAEADRRCRARRPPHPRDLIARSVALDQLGRPEAAEKDIEVAAGWSTGEPDVEGAVLRRGSPARRRASAGAVLGRDRVPRGDAAAALACLAGAGTQIFLTASREVGGARARVYASRPNPVTLVVRAGAAGAAQVVGPRMPNPVPHEAGWWAVVFDLVLDDAEPVELRAQSRSARSEPTILYPRATVGVARVARGRPGPARGGVTAVVPIYGDPASLSACLASLAAQWLPGLRIVVVDDGSPVAEVSRLGRDFCGARGRLYLRAGLNAGFAAAVNRALDAIPTGDVLILNSDVVLPAGAVERLTRAAGQAGVGTVSALSNDAGHTSFPVPFGPNPCPAPEAAGAADRAAQACNAGRVVDVIAGLGSCLYVTRACLDRVGPLSAAYGRGYYEDVDFCLRARERGFRNVAAPDVYVAHASGRSFGGARPALVARNRAVLDARFPGYTAAAAASIAADPLARARGRMEEAVGIGTTSTVLVVGGPADDLARLDRLRAGIKPGTAVIAAEWRLRAGAVEVDLRAHPAGLPHALSFRLDAGGRARLRAYLSRLPNPAAEVLGWDAVPPALLATLAEAEVPLSRLIDGPAEAEALSRAAEPARRMAVPADRMAAAALGRDTPAAGAAPARGSVPVSRLAVPMPVSCPAAEAFVVALGRALRLTRPVRLVVLGACLDADQVMAAGNAHVSGPVEVEDYPDAVATYRADALLWPYRTAGFGFVDGLSRAGGLAKAYFDWSGGRLAAEPGDLALGHDRADAEAVAAVAAWCGGAREAAA